MEQQPLVPFAVAMDHGELPHIQVKNLRPKRLSNFLTLGHIINDIPPQIQPGPTDSATASPPDVRCRGERILPGLRPTAAAARARRQRPTGTAHPRCPQIKCIILSIVPAEQNEAVNTSSTSEYEPETRECILHSRPRSSPCFR